VYNQTNYIQLVSHGYWVAFRIYGFSKFKNSLESLIAVMSKILIVHNVMRRQNRLMENSEELHTALQVNIAITEKSHQRLFIHNNLILTVIK
jgi:hypothetical protein